MTLANRVISAEIEKLASTLKDMGTASSSELAILLGYKNAWTVKNRMQTAKKYYPDNIVSSKAFGYKWVETPETEKAEPKVKEAEEEKKVVDVKAVEVPEVKPEPKPEPVSKTTYPDPTAFQALLDAEAKKVVSPKYHPGDIWEYQRAYYNKSTPIGELYLILGAFPGTNTVLKLVELDEMYDGRYDMLLDIKGKAYYVDPRRVESRAEKGFCRRVDGIKPYHLEAIRKLIGSTLGVRYVETKTVTEVVEKKVEVPVEKIVEKVVEKRVEVPVEEPGTVRIDATEYALLKQRADLWERAFKMVAGK